MKRIVLLCLSLSLPAWGQFGNATKLQTVPIKSTLACSNNYVITYVSANGRFECLANGGASGSVTTSGFTTNTLPKATGSAALGDSHVTDDGTTISATTQFSIKANPLILEFPNSSTGTTANKLAKLVNTAGVLQAEIITTSAADQTAAIGCVVGGAGNTGTALIMIAGRGSCYVDGAVTAGHVLVPSSTSAGALHDSGSASTIANGQSNLATAGATNACASPPCLIAGNAFMTPDIVALNSGGNGGGGGNNGGKNIKSWTIITGDPGAASSALADDNDSPVSAQNDVGSDITITGVSCWADAGSPTITPILTGGNSTSVLTGALTCGTASFAYGTLNTTPTVHSFSGSSSSRTCASTPCSIDANITSAGGVAKYIVVNIVGTYK